MRIEPINFYTQDGLELYGLLYLSEIETTTVVISVHGITSNCLKKRDTIIAEELTKKGIAYFTFNNRGHDIVNTMPKILNGKRTNVLQGSSLEDIEEGYYDITTAIQEMVQRGYSHIHLQGHSLGCTKIVYTYHQLQQEKSNLLEKINSILLLSLVDVVSYTSLTFGKENIQKILKIAEKLEEEKHVSSFLPLPEGTPPICAKTFLRYARDYQNIDFAKYREEEYQYPILNQITVPLFMRWGDTNELIEQNVNELITLLKEKIRNKNLNIGYIEGASHNYTGKEKELAEQMAQFIVEN